MTARHCVSTQAQANTLEVVWFFQTDVCNGTPPNINTRPRNTGALLLKTHQNSDWTLLGLFDPARTGVPASEDIHYWGPNSSAVGVHHPGGSFKRIHFGTKTVDTFCTAVGSPQQYLVQASQGAARRGSSGSPAFDALHRVRGTLSCEVDESCPPFYVSTYGRLDAFFPIGRWYISQMASPVYANWSVPGDPGKEGDSERGTAANPFKTVYDATFCVRSGDTSLSVQGTTTSGFGYGVR